MLFDVVPDNFFGPLAAPGKLVYWECICRLFSVTSRQLSFGVERDVLVDELQYYFESAMSADIPEEELEDAGSMTSRDKANFMLRRLESYGWIYIDVDYSYVQRVNFRDYAIQVIKALLAVSEERRAEYQGYIYTIYNLARAGGTNPGLGLLQIAENMDALITGLKSLNANIKRYIDELTKHSTVAEIMDALLNDYYTNVVDKAYHRLLTSDNVAKFRPEIIEQLYDSPLKFIFYIDDLSFGQNDDDFSSLKGILEGNVADYSKNIAIYATSNRRHLVRESMEARVGDDLHLNDTLQETMSLSARFGLTITFSKPEKDLYLSIVKNLSAEYGIQMAEDELFKKAEAFAIRSNGRSPRTAKQFVRLLSIGIK